MEAWSISLQMKTRKCPVLLSHASESQRRSLLGDLQPGRERALGWAVWRGEGAQKQNSLAETTAAVRDRGGEGFLGLP